MNKQLFSKYEIDQLRLKEFVKIPIVLTIQVTNKVIKFVVDSQTWLCNICYTVSQALGLKHYQTVMLYALGFLLNNNDKIFKFYKMYKSKDDILYLSLCVLSALG